MEIPLGDAAAGLPDRAVPAAGLPAGRGCGRRRCDCAAGESGACAIRDQRDGRWAPQPVANVLPGLANAEVSNPNAATEKTVPVEGLINLNTAPWRVLAAVPWLPPPQTPDRKGRWLADNAWIAQAIVTYRDGSFATAGHGPFRSLFESNRVVLPDGRVSERSLGIRPEPCSAPARGDWRLIDRWGVRRPLPHRPTHRSWGISSAASWS